MAIFKCKMCGGNLEINDNSRIATCESCGTKQTLPHLDDERRLNLYDRANHFRRNNEFDKAMSIYESILNEDTTDAEAYWSIILCKYGIEYVEDAATHKRVITCNRTQYTSIYADEDYKSAIEKASGEAKELYTSEAAEIDRIQKGILEISSKEEPFDVFICYKETDNSGRRTQDSVLAQELYFQLKNEGFKVFFSRITLEDKLGTAYEPYIFAALNSAKAMVVIATRPEYVNSPWVKNEWGRYLSIIKNNPQKILIPAYRDMDPYDLPDEFSHLQAQDMSKLGFMQDLVRGIKKIVDNNEPKTTVKETVVTTPATNIAPLLKRAFMFLEDGEFDRADEFCEQILNQDPEYAEAYLGKLMVALQVQRREDLSELESTFNDNSFYQKAYRFADEKLKKFLDTAIHTINKRNEDLRIKGIFAKATNLMSLDQESGYEEAATLFKSIAEFRNSNELYEKCLEKAEEKRKDRIYRNACSVLDDTHYWVGKQTDISAHEEAIKDFESLSGYKDSEQKIIECRNRIEEIKYEQEKQKIVDEEARLEQLRIAEQKKIENEIKAKKLR